MPIKFKNSPLAEGGDHTKTFGYLKERVQQEFDLPHDALIEVGFSRTTVTFNEVRLELPFGVQHLKAGVGMDISPAVTTARTSLLTMVKGTPAPQYSAASEKAGGVPIPAPNLNPSDMTDEEWVTHVAGQLFPGTIHLHTATELYQPVLGTGGGSIYKTCFIGPNLKVAARLKKESVSFRATTENNERPTGEAHAILSRLGLNDTGNDRMTGHASMAGPYDNAHAAEYRALFGAYYAALKPHITTNFPAIVKLTEGVK